jgi:hypothetical protein
VTAEELFWQAARWGVEAQGHGDKMIQPQAQKLADDYLLALEPQLRLLGGSRPRSDANHERFFKESREEAVTMFAAAIKVRGLMRAGGEYFTYQWHPYGTALDRTSMSDGRGSTGHQTVKWCMGPTIWAQQTKLGKKTVNHKSRVFCLTKPEDRVRK